MLYVIIGLILLAITATRLFLRSTERNSSLVEDNSNAHLEMFIQNSLKYDLSLDDCHFKDASFITEEEQKNEALISAGLLVGSTAGLYYTPVERVENVRAVLFYQKPDLFNNKRFIQTFPIDMTTLKYHVLTGTVKLFIDIDNPDKYAFLLERDAV